MHPCRGKAGDGNVNFEEDIEGNDSVDAVANDAGGEDRGSCSPAMPRGCVV